MQHKILLPLLIFKYFSHNDMLLILPLNKKVIENVSYVHAQSSNGIGVKIGRWQ